MADIQRFPSTPGQQTRAMCATAVQHYRSEASVEAARAYNAEERRKFTDATGIQLDADGKPMMTEALLKCIAWEDFKGALARLHFMDTWGAQLAGPTPQLLKTYEAAGRMAVHYANDNGRAAREHAVSYGLGNALNLLLNSLAFCKTHEQKQDAAKSYVENICETYLHHLKDERSWSRPELDEIDALAQGEEEQ